MGDRYLVIAGGRMSTEARNSRCSKKFVRSSCSAQL